MDEQSIINAIDNIVGSNYSDWYIGITDIHKDEKESMIILQIGRIGKLTVRKSVDGKVIRLAQKNDQFLKLSR